MRLLVVVLVLAALVVVPFLIWGEAFEAAFSTESAAAWMEENRAWAWSAAIALLVSDIALPIPGTAVMAATGAVYGFVVGGLVSAGGSILSGAVAYGVCRRLGRPAAEWIAGKRDLERSEIFFARAGGGWAVVLSRWLPVFPEVVAAFAGLARMPARRFYVALACGSAPLGFVFAAVGASGRDRPLLAVALSAALPVVLWTIAGRMLRARARSPGEAAERAPPRD